MRNLLLLTAVFLSSAAFAQPVQLRLSNGQETQSFGPTTCSGRVSITWTRTSTTICEQLSLWLTQPGKNCGDSPEAGDVGLDAITLTELGQSNTGTFQVDLGQLPFPTTGGGGGCGALTQDATFRLCGATKVYGGSFGTDCNTVSRASGMKFVYDGTPPTAPVIEDARGLDQAVLADVSEPTGATVIELHVSRDGTEVAMVRQDVGRGAIRVEGLENEVTYQLVAYAFDQAENRSNPSEAREASPTKTNGFMEEYANAGGKEMGGCGAAGGGVVGSAVLAALGFWLSSRRNRS
ncbi:MXAN_2561 family MXYO-CTERM-anchored protein [Archangium lipolyticum]|uniref:MXAN_2561 family MXYO-CTERM-anchored protein n=1 Tax=Archangium lipolyticum TaxID=2970465 RepID=UPI00214A3A0F|nr:MXAN_2561 family MXYO-CTERM-anchored protein [Archangium lipolyticum]